VSANYPPGVTPQMLDDMLGDKTCEHCGHRVSTVAGKIRCGCEEDPDAAYEAYRDQRATEYEAEKAYSDKQAETEGDK